MSANVLYHRSCYQSYTNTEKLAYRCRKKNDALKVNMSEINKGTSMKTWSSTTNITINKCIICNCAKKNGDKILYQVRTFNVQTNIREAILINDSDLISKTQDINLIAIEAKYHKNCLAKLLVMKDHSNASRETPTTSKADDISTYDQVFEYFWDEVHIDICNGRAYTMQSLLSMYQNKLQAAEYENFEKYRAKKLENRMQRRAGYRVRFISSNNPSESEIIYSNAIDLAVIKNKIADSKRSENEQSISESLSVNIPDNLNRNYFTRAAFYLNKVAQSAIGLSINPVIDYIDMSNERAMMLVPQELYEFVHVLLFGLRCNNIYDSNDATHRRVLSLSQDIIYTVNSSRCKTPKHVGLALTLKHLTGSCQVIDFVHGLGNCASYDDCIRMKSAIARNLLSK